MTRPSKDSQAISGIRSREFALGLVQKRLSLWASDWRMPDAEAALTDARHRAAPASSPDHHSNREAELARNWVKVL